MACRTAILGVAAILATACYCAGTPPRLEQTVARKEAAPGKNTLKGDHLGKPVAVEVDGKPLAATGSPFFGDFDGDGLPDLLLGYGQDGRLQIYRNVGTKTAPRLTGPQWFDDRVPTGRIPRG